MRQSNEYYASGGKKSAIISPKEPMGIEKAGQLKTAFDSFLQTPATKTLFINTEVDVKEISSAQSPREIMEALKTINGLLIEQFGIPPYLYGDFSGYINDASIVTACRLFFQIQMKPVFKSIEYQFTRYFRNTLKIKGAVVKLNFEDIEILEDSLQTKIENSTKLWKLGLVSMNEAREMCELERLQDEAANRHFIPSYLTGQYPVAIEQFDDTMDRLFSDKQITDQPQGQGSSGGTDNENLITGSTGGPGNTGE